MKRYICLSAVILSVAACGSNEASKVETSLIESQARKWAQDEATRKDLDLTYGVARCVRDSDTHAACVIKESYAGVSEEKGIEAILDKDTGDIRFQGGK
jgi:hypothetical protein